MRSVPRTLLLASLLAAAVGCDHRPEDFSRVQDSTAAFTTGWTRRVSELELRRTALFERAQKLPAETPGLAEAMSQLAAIEVEIEALDGKAATVGQAATAKVQEKRARLADETLATGETDLTVDLKGIASRLDGVAGQLDALDRDAADKAAAAAANRPPPQLDDPEFARGTFRTDVPGIAFRAGQLDLTVGTTQTALDRVVAFANRCDQLRFAIIGHTAKDGAATVNQQLSEARAHAVRKHLIAAGVAEGKVVQVQGVGGTAPLLPEPEPGTPEEAAMETGELARIRNVNRRISLQVVTPCP